MALPEFNPNTAPRNEQYLHRIATGEGGVPDPVTREDQYLHELATNGTAAEREIRENMVGKPADGTPANYTPTSDGEGGYSWQPGGGSGSWGAITGKPFESIGSGLTVDTQGVLSAEAAMETFVFKGYVSSTAPTGTIKAGAMWYQGTTMPTSFPVQVKTYDGTAWSAETEDYTPEALEMWANLADNHGYYWFGNAWNIIDVNVEYDGVTINANAQGQLQIKATAADNGKFMVCTNGQAGWVSVPQYEGGSY